MSGGFTLNIVSVDIMYVPLKADVEFRWRRVERLKGLMVKACTSRFEGGVALTFFDFDVGDQ